MYAHTVDPSKTLADQFEQRGTSAFHESPATAELVYVMDDGGSDHDLREMQLQQASDDAAEVAAAMSAAVRILMRVPEDDRRAAWADMVVVASPRVERHALYTAFIEAMTAANVAEMAEYRASRGWERLAADLGVKLVG